MSAPDTQVSFEDWANARLASLMRFGYLVTGSQTEAEDSVQAALEKVCRRWSRIQTSDNPETYVRRMIANEHVSAWRRFGRRVSPVAEVAPPVSGAVGMEESDALWQACLALPRRQRAAVVLRFYEDRDYDEIAAILEISESTARAHIHRGLAALRTALSEENQ